ncbi:MAG: hypothetical protein M3312_07140 [Actinomycetota bacterium]|nr:hypothetical protein [Actinomycetota bacterium]
MTTPAPDFFDLVSIVSRLRDPVSIRITRSMLETQVQVLEAQVAQLREVTKTLAEVERSSG